MNDKQDMWILYSPTHYYDRDYILANGQHYTFKHDKNSNDIMWMMGPKTDYVKFTIEKARRTWNTLISEGWTQTI
tara:strand:- start:332 stop:556 length:225 start_codon:yes stop_codon:yes gene_type:complete